MRDNPLIALFAVFAPLSLLTIGGGQSVVSDIHRQVVAQNHWMTDQQFLDAFAISRTAPGPGSLLVSLIGWDLAGWKGAIAASIAIFGPSSILVYGLARLWARYRGAAWQRAIEAGLRPLAAGLVLASVYTVLRAAEGGWLAWLVAGTSTLILSRSPRVSPFAIMGAGALVFLLVLR